MLGMFTRPGSDSYRAGEETRGYTSKSEKYNAKGGGNEPPSPGRSQLNVVVGVRGICRYAVMGYTTFKTLHRDYRLSSNASS